MNLHYEFWVRYYDFLALSDGKDQICRIYDANKRIVDSKWDGTKGKVIPFQDHSLCLKVQYPGLLVGLGNSHDSSVKPVEPTDQNGKRELQEYVQGNAALKSEIGLGAFLDHVTGLPVIPGSQVKGMLRSAFIRNPGYIAEILGWEGDDAKENVCKLEQDIFGGRHPLDKRKNINTDEKGRDCFLDAFPVKPEKGNRLFGIENITPHHTKDKKYARLNSPNILQLLKVIPGVVFQFRFILKDSIVGDKTVNVEEKLKLFSQIFQDLGVGAKTNVGFGGVEPDENGKKYKYLVCTSADEAETAASNAADHRPAEVRRTPAKIEYARQIQPGVVMEGKYLQDKEILLFENEKFSVKGIVPNASGTEYQPGDTVLVRVVSLLPKITLEIL